MSVEREIGYIKVSVCQPPSAPIWWNQLQCIWRETGQSSSTPNPWIKAKSYSGEICSALGNPLWMWERTAQWVFRGRFGVLGLEREQAGEDFISTVLHISWKKQSSFGFLMATSFFSLQPRVQVTRPCLLSFQRGMKANGLRSFRQSSRGKKQNE